MHTPVPWTQCDGCDEEKEGKQTRPLQCLWKGTFEPAGQECRSEPVPVIEQTCTCEGKL